MRSVHQSPHLLLAHMKAVQQRVVARRCNDSKVYEPAPHFFEQIVRAAVEYAEAYVRMQPHEAGEPFGGDIRGPSFDQADVYGAFHALSHRADVRLCVFGKAEYLLGPPVEQLSGFSEFEAPPASYEELRLEFFLKALDAGAQRRLAHVQFFGGSCYIEFFRHHYEVLQRSEIHVRNLLYALIRLCPAVSAPRGARPRGPTP